MPIGTTELIIILIAVLLLFGYKKLPDAARSVGKSMRVFKAETKAMKDDDTADAASATPRPADYTQHPADAPAPLPVQSADVAQQREQAQRYLDSTARPTAAEPPTTPR